MPNAMVSGYEGQDDPWSQIMYEAGWIPAPRLDANTTIPKVVEPGSVLILGGKGYVPGSNALRGPLLRRYLEAYTGPLHQKMDFENFVDSAKQLGILEKKVTPITVDPLPSPPELSQKAQQDQDYEDYLAAIRNTRDPFEAKYLGEAFLSKWRK